MTAIRFLGMATLLLLGGCLEATDSITGNIRSRAEYCVVPPDAVVLCPDSPPRKTLWPRRAGGGIGTGAVTNS